MPFEEGTVPLDRADLDAAAAALGMRPDDAATLLVVTLPGGSSVPVGRPRASVNLRAPIIVDRCRGTAVQCVLPQPGYQVRHLLDESV
jgi:hypothetical protein